MRSFLLKFLILLISSGIQGQIKSGPMLTYNTMRQVGVWVELEHAADLTFTYFANSSPNETVNISATTSPYGSHTVSLDTELLEPGSTYTYFLLVNDDKYGPYHFTTQPLWDWRMEPPAFSFLAGSCVYINEAAYDRPGKPYGGQYEIFESMGRDTSDFMIWLGDNNYLREADWSSVAGIYHRYSHSRAVPELQALLNSRHHYGIWDDHDYGPNDSDWTYHMKDITLEAYKAYWPMPNYHIGNSEGITNYFKWVDCDFFMLDNRWYRDPKNTPDGSILGNVQVDWLIDALRSSKAPFKFICVGGQFVSDLAAFENHANYPSERQYILDQIEAYNIKGVVFLTGDRHHSEISKIQLKDDLYVLDITSSPISSRAYDHSDEKNSYRVQNSLIGERNYAHIHVSGKRKERQLGIEFKNSIGETIRKFTFNP